MEFISRGDVLKLFDISVWTLRRWQNERQFPEAIAASGRVRMYNKSEVENWLISLSNSSNTHEPSRFSGGTNELS